MKRESDAIAIRTARPEDADTIVNFNCAMARESEGRALPRATAVVGARRVLEDASLGQYFVAEAAGRIVGQLLITYEWSDWRNGLFWWIQSVYVESAQRGRGVYRRLHEHVERLARQTAGVCGLRLYVERSNAGAQAVYQRLGMQRTAYDLFETDWSAGA